MMFIHIKIWIKLSKDLGGFIVGDNGHIYMTKDAGLTWDKMTTNISEDLFTVE